jgi:hypothetical protein
VSDEPERPWDIHEDYMSNIYWYEQEDISIWESYFSVEVPHARR